MWHSVIWKTLILRTISKLKCSLYKSLVSGLRVWTSWLKRTIQTAAHIDAPQERWRALNEIDAGCMEHLTYEDIEEKYPEEYEAREVNKLTYRYPSGESYQVEKER